MMFFSYLAVSYYFTMYTVNEIPPPFLCNPLKHHLGFIRDYIDEKLKSGLQTDNMTIIRDLKHLGGSLMDVYTGSLKTGQIINEISEFLKEKNLTGQERFLRWAGNDPKNYKTITLSDGSQWILKYYNDDLRYVHPFPSRCCSHSFRIKANTLKSAILYMLFTGKDFITEEDLNLARAIAGLSPVKEVVDAEAITEMIEMLRA
jgi:hypothetical protein